MKTDPIRTPKDWKYLVQHPLAAIVEMGVGIDIEAGAAHMKEHGYDPQNAIVLFEGKMLDGRHTHAMCLLADITPTFREYTGANPAAFVFAKKAHRQHLNASMRAMIAASWVATCKSAKLRSDPVTLDQAAKSLGVSNRIVDDAATVVQNGTPELNAAVADGTASASDAAAIADQPAKEQNRRVKQLRGGKRKTLSESAPRKNGQPEYDPRDVTTLCSKLIAQADKLCLAYGEVDAAGKVIEGYSHKSLRQRVEEVRDFFERWQKQLMKKEKVK